MKKKVLFVMENLVMGGVTRVFVNLLKNLDYSKYEVDLIVLHYYEDMPAEIPPEVTLIKGDKTYKYVDMPIRRILKQKDIPAFFGKLKLALCLKSGLIKYIIRRSRKKLLSKHYDTEIAFNDGFTQVFTANGNSKRKIAWLHADISVFNDSARYANLIADSLKEMDAFACVSSQVKTAYTMQYGIQNAEVIHNIMDSSGILRGAELPADVSFDNDSVNLISVGRLCDAKNFCRFIRIHKMLLDQGYPVHSYIIGDGPDRSILEAEINRLGINDTFTMLGRRENPFPYVKQADLFVLSSDHEGLPTVLYEALILGTPCVSTHVAGSEEILESGRYGIISDVDDSALFEAIKEMLSGDNLNKYRDAVRSYQFSIPEIIEKVENIL